jgi:hypothetical protein
MLRAPFPGVMPYDITLGGARRRIATDREGTRLIVARGRVTATCVLTGRTATLDI